MLPNFLHPCMQPTVRCSVPCAEDHTAQNLLAAPQTAAHAAGFVAYAVVRPPVHLDFQLVCAVELHSVAIWTRHGSMCTNGLEVCVRDSTTDDDFVKIGQAYEWPAAAEGVRFVNVNFANGSGGGSNDTANDNASTTQQLHDFQFFRTLGRRMAVRQLRISIKRMLNRAVPSLKMVRITGRPAAWCMPAAEYRIHLDRWASRLPTFGFYGSDSSSNISDDSTSTMASTLGQPSDKDEGRPDTTAIPEEFLDAITCEIMSLPMTLPSGKCVDRTTLERHQTTLASSWGRQPSDPFTGLPFTTVRRPLLNAALKSQIDRFLLQHQHRSDLRAVPRTVGTVASAAPKRRADVEHQAVAKSSRGADNRQQQDPPLATSSASLPDVASGSASCGDCGDSRVLYTIRTCTHSICRSCLLLAKLWCARCERPFQRSDVVRLHDKPIE